MALQPPSARGPHTLDGQLWFGADYYPEDHSFDEIEQDAAAMQRAGFNMVRILDTNWAAVEPEDGHFDFAWLDRTLDVLNRHGLRVVMGVPSYVPPYWLFQAHPEILLIRRDGVRMRTGGMGGVDRSNPVYLSYVDRLDRALADHYGHDPRVVGWQIDNEIGVWGDDCYNSDCVAAFHDYLRKKYGSIEALNQRWGTVSYGHQYTSFDQVPLDWQPVAEGHQSSQFVEVRRFFSQMELNFIGRQAAVFRQRAPGQWVTHNAVSPVLAYNTFDLVHDLDFVGYDNYPVLDSDAWGPSFALDTARGYNRGAPFLIPEEAAGAPGPYTLTGPEPAPAQLRLWAYQALAHGANGVLFFRWRTARSGSEVFWQGLLDHAGSSSPRLREIARMGEEVNRLRPYLPLTRSQARVGIVFSWESWAALSVGQTRSDYVESLREWQHSLRTSGYDVDVLPPDADLSGYRALLAPNLYMVSSGLVSRLRQFVEGGGVLVLGPRAGITDQDDRFDPTVPPPSWLAPLAGSTVEETTLLSGAPVPAGPEYHPATTNQVQATQAGWHGPYQAHGWSEILHPSTAQPLFQYQHDFYAGGIAATVHRVGAGRVYYLGSRFGVRFRHDFLAKVLPQAGVQPLLTPPPGVEAVSRSGPQGEMLFLLNLTNRPQMVHLTGRWLDLLARHPAADAIQLPGLDVRVLLRKNTAQKE